MLQDFLGDAHFKAVKKSGIPNIRRHTDFSTYLWEIADDLHFFVTFR